MANGGPPVVRRKSQSGVRGRARSSWNRFKRRAASMVVLSHFRRKCSKVIFVLRSASTADLSSAFFPVLAECMVRKRAGCCHLGILSSFRYTAASET